MVSGASDNKYNGYYYCYSTIIIVIIALKNEMGGSCSPYGGGERRGVYRVLVGKPEGKRPLVRSRRRREDNIKLDLQEVGCRGLDWIELAHDRDKWGELANAVMKFRVP